MEAIVLISFGRIDIFFTGTRLRTGKYSGIFGSRDSG